MRLNRHLSCDPLSHDRPTQATRPYSEGASTVPTNSRGGRMSPPAPMPLDYFSLRTPLKGFVSEVFTSMKRPVVSSRLTQWPLGIWTCERSRTAPTRRLSPVGAFFATGTTSYVRRRLVT